MKVVRLSVLRTDRLYPKGDTPDTHFCYEVVSTPGPQRGRRNMSIKNSDDTNRNRTRDLSACSAVPQPNAPPRVKRSRILQTIHFYFCKDTKNVINNVLTTTADPEKPPPPPVSSKNNGPTIRVETLRTEHQFWLMQRTFIHRMWVYSAVNVMTEM
jgi:hypothetical protein